jgi:hypothetical protein
VIIKNARKYTSMVKTPLIFIKFLFSINR